jgi:hypothetical protein
MPQLPPHALEHGIGGRQRLELELGRWRELVPPEALVTFFLLLGIILPLDIALPAIPLLRHHKARIVRFGIVLQLELPLVGVSGLRRVKLDLEIALVAQAKLVGL